MNLSDYVASARPFVERIMSRGGTLQSKGMPWQAGARPNSYVDQGFKSLGPQSAPLWAQTPAQLQAAPPPASFNPPTLPPAMASATSLPPTPPAAPEIGQTQYPVQEPGMLDRFLRAIFDKGNRGFASEPEGPRVGPFAR